MKTMNRQLFYTVEALVLKKIKGTAAFEMDNISFSMRCI
jgi:hypothetical protein